MSGRSERGFTLIEAAIAAAISAVAFAMLFWGIGHAWKLWDDFRVRMEVEATADRVVRQLRLDVESAEAVIAPTDWDRQRGELLGLRQDSGAPLRYRQEGRWLVRERGELVEKVEGCRAEVTVTSRIVRARILSERRGRNVERLVTAVAKRVQPAAP